VVFVNSDLLPVLTMNIIKYLVITIITAILYGACRKIEQLPPVPYIEFSSFAVFDTLDILGNQSRGGRLLFRFEDGDGDLGLEEPNGFQTDTTNMNLTLFRKKDGVMVEVTDKNDPLLPYSSYRIPFMDRPGQNKILKGTISVTFLYQFYTIEDTIKYEFYITDRAGNNSNVVSTAEIIVAENNLYTE